MIMAAFFGVILTRVEVGIKERPFRRLPRMPDDGLQARDCGIMEKKEDSR
jgi:hypothetical protein